MIKDHVHGSPNTRRWQCFDVLVGAAVLNKKDPEFATEMVLCNWFYMQPTIEGVPGKIGGREIGCDALGKRVSMIMYTRGQMLLHEYTNVQDIMRPLLGEEQKITRDHAYGFADCRSSDKNMATKTADSYSCFASELFWTTKCDETLTRQ